MVSKEEILTLKSALLVPRTRLFIVSGPESYQCSLHTRSLSDVTPSATMVAGSLSLSAVLVRF